MHLPCHPFVLKDREWLGAGNILVGCQTKETQTTAEHFLEYIRLSIITTGKHRQSTPNWSTKPVCTILTNTQNLTKFLINSGNEWIFPESCWVS